MAKPDEELKKNPTSLKSVEKVKEQEIQWQKFAVFAVAGAITAVVIGIGVQAAYDKFVIKPAQEKSFSRKISYPHSEGFRQIFDRSTLLSFLDVENNRRIVDFQIKSASDQAALSLNDLDWYQYQEGDGINFGKLQYQYDHLIVTIRYLIQGSYIYLIIDASGLDHYKNNATHLISIQQNQENVIIVDGFQEALIFPADESKILRNFDEIKSIYINLTEEWNKQFEIEYRLQQKNLPVFYQEMGRIALSTVLSSFGFENETTFTGSKNGRFVANNHLYTIEKSKPKNLNFLSEQIFPLIVASRSAQADVEKVLGSFMASINDLKEISTLIENKSHILGAIQQPMLFQFLKTVLNLPSYVTFLKSIYPILEVIAEETMRNSAKESIQELKWLENSEGIFGRHGKNNEKESSLELNSLLQDMNSVMAEISKLVGSSGEKYEAQRLTLRTDRSRYWSKENSVFGDIKDGEWFDNSLSNYVPLILGQLDADSTELSELLAHLENDEKWSQLGLRENSNEGAQISVNYLLLGSLKNYSYQSGPNQHKAHVLFSVLKNNWIAYTAKSFKNSRFFFDKYDKNGVAQGFKDSNNGALILNIMAEIFV